MAPYTTCLNGPHGFSLNGGTYTSLNVPGSLATEALGINNAGTIFWQYWNTSGGFAQRESRWPFAGEPKVRYSPIRYFLIFL